MEKPQKIDAKALKRGISRRALLKDVILAGATGAVVGSGTHVGLGYLGNRFEDFLVEADKQIKELAIDVKVLSGSLERKMASETKELKESYTSGKLRMYQEMGIATPQELSELESIIKTNEAFEAEYGFVQRLRVFKDRINSKILAGQEDLIDSQLTVAEVDSKVESYQPGFMRRVNEWMRQVAPGIKEGQEGKKQRETARVKLEYTKADIQQRRKRLTALCDVYDTNEDSKIAETEVLKKINIYIKDGALPDDEKKLYEFLQKEYQTQGSKEHLRDFIRNYEVYDGRRQVLSSLKASIEGSEAIYEKIQENKKYVSDLQGILKDGIELKTRIREQTPREFGAYEEQIQAKVTELRASVDGIIKELESKGYNIDTREEAIDRGTFMKTYYEKFSDFWNPIRIAGGVVAGAAAAAGAFYLRNKGRESRSYKQALKIAVDSNNQSVDAYDALENRKNAEIEKYKSQGDYEGT